ncbi:MAG TPA: hypothetical protein VJ919_01525 [Tangfeifania sp.]|nr:hypothetical protein [Tangfeifania sp.]
MGFNACDAECSGIFKTERIVFSALSSPVYKNRAITLDESGANFMSFLFTATCNDCLFIPFLKVVVNVE